MIVIVVLASSLSTLFSWIALPTTVHGYVDVRPWRSLVQREVVRSLPRILSCSHRTKDYFRSSLFSQSVDSNLWNGRDPGVLDCDVAVFGGGFGGLYTALSMYRQEQSKRSFGAAKPCRIVLVEPTEQFVFLPLLYDLTVGTATEAEVCPTYNDLLQNTNIRHIRASLESIQPGSTGTSATARLRPVNGAEANAVTQLRMKAGIIAVGASPESILAQVPGATQYALPFYTASHAKQLRRLLYRLDEISSTNEPPRIRVAVIGGGYGGVELAASVQRRLPQAEVRLLCRGPPLRNTRAEASVNAALQKLGVTIEPCNVLALEEAVTAGDKSNVNTLLGRPKVHIRRTDWETDAAIPEDEQPWDVVLWTAGSAPADPVSSTGCDYLQKTSSGRLAIESTMRCLYSYKNVTTSSRFWALGDCAEIVSDSDRSSTKSPALPKTAQVAMQQADVVSANVLLQLQQDGNRDIGSKPQDFVFQDLGSMLTLGGPNGALLAPKEDSALAPLLVPLLNTAGTVLGFADGVVGTLSRSPVVEQLGLPTVEGLGLSLGSHGLGWTSGGNGTLAGTLTGAARRTVYAARMPTPQQRALSLVSATLSTAAALFKENIDRNQKQ